jgi:hypothetical protein
VLVRSQGLPPPFFGSVEKTANQASERASAQMCSNVGYIPQIESALLVWLPSRRWGALPCPLTHLNPLIIVAGGSFAVHTSINGMATAAALAPRALLAAAVLPRHHNGPTHERLAASVELEVLCYRLQNECLEGIVKNKNDPLPTQS